MLSDDKFRDVYNRKSLVFYRYLHSCVESCKRRKKVVSWTKTDGMNKKNRYKDWFEPEFLKPSHAWALIFWDRA